MVFHSANRREATVLFLIVIFVGLTSLPAVLYAIPVETFMSSEGAGYANFIFLAVVAVWRVCLLCVFCSKVVGLSRWGVTLLPLTGIMILLATLYGPLLSQCLQPCTLDQGA